MLLSDMLSVNFAVWPHVQCTYSRFAAALPHERHAF